MKQIQGTRYVLAVHDLDASTDYYIKKLGFKLLSNSPGWSFLGRESFIVMLGECKDTIAPNQLADHSYFAYVTVNNAEVLYKEFLGKNVVIKKELQSELWGMKEFAIETLDGHQIMFGEDIQNLK